MPKKGLPQPMVNADHIKEQAALIRDIAQKIVEACESGTVIDAYARNKVATGDLAQDAAALGIMIVAHEYEEGW